MLSSYDELAPGDAVDAPGHHVVLFVGWNDAAHTGLCVIEQESTALGMQFHVRSTESMQGEYQPMRSLSLGNSGVAAAGSTTGPGLPVPKTSSGTGGNCDDDGCDDD
jgi:hypothetical protein